MPIIATKSEFPERELIPAGNYIARCYKMVEIGTIKESFKTGDKMQHKVRVGWELPTEFKVFNPEKGPQPLVIEKEYTLSMDEKSNLRRDLKSWRGSDFTEEQAAAFDITALLGVPCMLNIIHKAGVKNPAKIYEEISGITPLPKGVQCPQQINPKTILSFDNFDDKLFESLPDFIKDKIKSSDQYKLMMMPDASAAIYTQNINKNNEDPADDLPF